jgi:hypothetical protein
MDVCFRLLLLPTLKPEGPRIVRWYIYRRSGAAFSLPIADTILNINRHVAEKARRGTRSDSLFQPRTAYATTEKRGN